MLSEGFEGNLGLPWCFVFEQIWHFCFWKNLEEFWGSPGVLFWKNLKKAWYHLVFCFWENLNEYCVALMFYFKKNSKESILEFYGVLLAGRI